MVAEKRAMTDANKLSDGFLPTWRVCPHCGSDNTRAMLNLTNAVYLAGIALLFLVQFISAWLIGEAGDGSPLALKRKCRQCRGTFWPKPIHEPAVTCGQCGYDLTGNVSGICPECGWKISLLIKRRIGYEETKSPPSQQV